MSDVQEGPGWWQASDWKWYPPEQHPDFQSQPFQPSAADVAAPAEPTTPAPRDPPLNELFTVSYCGGWIGLFAGESQEKALQRAVPEINSSGRRVVAAVQDRWSVWKRLDIALLLLVTLGFVGKVPNVFLITENG
jgi:hypothetical protein